LNKRILISFLAALALATVPTAEAQPHKPYRIGVIHEGGQYSATIDGLKDGLRELGLEPGKDVLLDIRDVQGNRPAAYEAARSLEREKVDLLYSVGTSVTLVVKGATAKIPIVFVGGNDSVAAGLVGSLPRPGGRLTGVQFLSVDLTAKRLEILKEMLPKLHKIITFYDSGNPVAGIKETRAAALRLNIEIVEHPVTSVEELRERFKALGPKDGDAFFYTPDAMTTSQDQFIIDTANAKKLPTMFGQPSLVVQGALAGYGVDFIDVGHLSAKYVQRVLTGTSPENLPIESFSRYGLGVNLKTARELGVTIPQSVLFRADKVIE
jgi:putative tryptophan/tyrosine transport system substrate-binding protein